MSVPVERLNGSGSESYETAPAEGVVFRFQQPEALLFVAQRIADSGKQDPYIRIGSFPLDEKHFKSANLNFFVRKPVDNEQAAGLLYTEIIHMPSPASRLGNVLQTENPFGFLSAHMPQSQDMQLNTQELAVTSNAVSITADGNDSAVLMQVWKQESGERNILLILVPQRQLTAIPEKIYEKISAIRQSGGEVTADTINQWIVDELRGFDLADHDTFVSGVKLYEQVLSSVLRALYTYEEAAIPEVVYTVDIRRPIEEKEISFEMFGGQARAIDRLRAVGIGHRPVLLHGPPGEGKSTMVKALEGSLRATTILMIPNTRLHAIGTEQFLDEGYFAAVKTAIETNRPVIYALDGLEGILQDPRDFTSFCNRLDQWKNNPRVIVVAIANNTRGFPETLVGEKGRFSEIYVEHPDEVGRREILEKDADRIARNVGIGIFDNIDFQRVAATFREKSGRGLVGLLEDIARGVLYGLQSGKEVVLPTTVDVLNFDQRKDKPGFRYQSK